MILKPKSPFQKDKSVCKVHGKPNILAFIHEQALTDDVPWFCEDCKPDTNGVLIDIKWEAETLKDTLWVEAWNFAHDIEKMKELNRKWIEQDSVD